MGRMDEVDVKVVELRPSPRPLAHGKRELMARRMGIHGDNAADAYRHVMGLAENEHVSSTAYNWSIKEEVRARVKHLRMEAARKDSERTHVDRNKVLDRLWDVADRARSDDKHTAEMRAFELLGRDAGMFKGIETGHGAEEMSDEAVAKELLRLKREAVGGSEENASVAGVGEGAEDSTAPELPAVPEAS